MRATREDGPPRKKQKNDKDVAALIRSVSALTAALSAKDGKTEGTDDEEEQDDHEDQPQPRNKGGANRNHPALTHQKRGTSKD